MAVSRATRTVGIAAGLLVLLSMAVAYPRYRSYRTAMEAARQEKVEQDRREAAREALRQRLGRFLGQWRSETDAYAAAAARVTPIVEALLPQASFSGTGKARLEHPIVLVEHRPGQDDSGYPPTFDESLTWRLQVPKSLFGDASPEDVTPVLRGDETLDTDVGGFPSAAFRVVRPVAGRWPRVGTFLPAVRGAVSLLAGAAPRTVGVWSTRSTVVGSYVSKESAFPPGRAMSTTVTVRLWTWPDGVPVGVHSFTGMPPSSSFVGEEDGEFEALKRMDAWLRANAPASDRYGHTAASEDPDAVNHVRNGSNLPPERALDCGLYDSEYWDLEALGALEVIDEASRRPIQDAVLDVSWTSDLAGIERGPTVRKTTDPSGQAAFVRGDFDMAGHPASSFVRIESVTVSHPRYTRRVVGGDHPLFGAPIELQTVK